MPSGWRPPQIEFRTDPSDIGSDAVLGGGLSEIETGRVVVVRPSQVGTLTEQYWNSDGPVLDAEQNRCDRPTTLLSTPPFFPRDVRFFKAIRDSGVHPPPRSRFLRVCV